MVLLYFVTAPAVASAGYNDIYAGWLNVNGAWGPRHSLSSVWATWYDGYDACMNALNDSDSTWAGSWGYCAHPGDTNRGHLYCACRLRWGYGYAAANNSWGYWRQFW